MTAAVMMLGAVCGVGLLVAAIAIAGPRPDAAVAVRRWETARNRSTPRTPATGVPQRLAGRLVAELARHGMELRSLRQDLWLLDQTLEQFVVTTVGMALLGLALPTVLGLLLAATAGVHPPLITSAAAAAALAAAASTVPALELRGKARARRADLRHALGAYLDLVAMSMAGGQGAPEALASAAAIGDGWAFGLLADTISRARYTGSTPWREFAELGTAAEVSELTDLGAALTLVAHDGAKVRDSLTARATTLRRRELADAEGAAAQADESMRIAQLVLAFGFLVFIGYPAVAAVLAL